MSLASLRSVRPAAVRAGPVEMRQGTNPAAAAALAALLLFQPLQIPLLPNAPMPAMARELASGSGSRVNKDPESLLRLGLPIQPKALVAAQTKLEEAQDQFLRMLPTTGKAALDNALGSLNGKSKEILAAVPAGATAEGEQLLAAIKSDANEVSSAISAGQLSAAQTKLTSSLKSVTALEELIASGYKQPVPPKEFLADLPYLKGRATIEWELKRPNAKFDVTTPRKPRTAALVCPFSPCPCAACHETLCCSEGANQPRRARVGLRVRAARSRATCITRSR